MERCNLTTQLLQFNLTRQRFESRLRFFARCLSDIHEDFHKQYGSFYQDWELTYDACAQYKQATDDYLRTRDIVAIEFKLLLGAIEEAQTEYAIKKATKRFRELMEVCQQNDSVTLTEIDEDIQNIKAVYQMIASAECEREE